MFPPVKAPPIHTKAKITASGCPSQRILCLVSPCAIKCIGPPEIVPSLLIFLYFSESETSANFKAMPIIAPNIIQKAVPGPPIEIEIATPAIVPKPTVPQRAAINAPYGDISPPALLSLGFRSNSKVCFTPQIAIPLKYNEKKMPAAKIHRIISGTGVPNMLTEQSIIDETLFETGVTHFDIAESKLNAYAC